MHSTNLSLHHKSVRLFYLGFPECMVNGCPAILASSSQAFLLPTRLRLEMVLPPIFCFINSPSASGKFLIGPWRCHGYNNCCVIMLFLESPSHRLHSVSTSLLFLFSSEATYPFCIALMGLWAVYVHMPSILEFWQGMLTLEIKLDHANRASSTVSLITLVLVCFWNRYMLVSSHIFIKYNAMPGVNLYFVATYFLLSKRKPFARW